MSNGEIFFLYYSVCCLLCIRCAGAMRKWLSNRHMCWLVCLFVIVALWNRADHYIFMLWFLTSSFMAALCNRAGQIFSSCRLFFFMVALCNRADHYIFALWFLSFFLLFFFPRL